MSFCPKATIAQIVTNETENPRQVSVIGQADRERSFSLFPPRKSATGESRPIGDQVARFSLLKREESLAARRGQERSTERSRSDLSHDFPLRSGEDRAQADR